MVLETYHERRNFIRSRAGKALERFKWIETTLREGSELDTKRYREHFKISQPLVSKDLDKYVLLFNEVGGIAERRHRWITVKEWPECGFVGSIDPLTWHRIASPDGYEDVVADQVLFEDPKVMQQFSQAIRTEEAITAVYWTEVGGVQHVDLSPHALVRAMGRSYVRAFNHDENVWLTIPLAQIVGVHGNALRTFLARDYDLAWHEVISLNAIVRPDLPEAKRPMILQSLGPRFGSEAFELTDRRPLIRFKFAALGVPLDSEQTYFQITEIESVSAS